LPDPSGLLLVEGRDAAGLGLLVVVVLRLTQRAQGIVPVGFQGVGDQTVVRVDPEIASAGQVGALPGPLNVVAAQCVRYSAARKIAGGGVGDAGSANRSSRRSWPTSRW
jgi:hypothetical protein